MIAQPRSAEEFCRQQHPRLVRSLAVYTGDRDLAEELAQEALARAYRDWGHVSTLDRPEAWAHRVAVEPRQQPLPAPSVRAGRAGTGRGADPGVQRPPPPLDRTVVAALAQLSRRQREALVLRFVLDLSVAATAQHMGCAEGTVRALTAQGVAALRRDPHLADLEEPGDD